MTTPRWLDGDEQVTWRAFLDATSLLTDRLDREIQHASGLSLIEYAVLAHLSEAEDRRLRMHTLAETVLVSKSRLSHQITRLEKEGLVARETCETDRRGAFAVLTGQGYELLVKVAPVHVEGVRRHLFDLLSEEQSQTLGEIAVILADHLRALPAAPATRH
ncbi:MAG: MarR family transcriptional regulator [Streptosporangiales bacterium]|nr:MarR family transcriptional regulator [Streptosporangiales bacterium]